VKNQLMERALVKLLLEGVEAVVFDLDGTLVDSSEAIISTIERVLATKWLTCNRADVARMMSLPLKNTFCILTF